MEAKKLIAVILVGLMVVSGLGIVSVGVNINDTVVSKPVDPVPKATVPRVVLLEDFTSWQCPPCATLNPLMSPAVDALGYTRVAPALMHVWWPNYDDDPVYQYDKQEVTNRVNYYGCNYVPWYMLDGTLTATPGSSAEVTAGINARSAVPANMTIWTQGYISGTTGSITAKVTAVENIAQTDLRLHVMLWENNITRALWDYNLPGWDSPPYPNGEDELDWAVWDYVPTEAGTAIWPSGATIGSSVEYTFPLTLNSSWDPNEMGVTVFVQSYGTKYVEQAAVETFHNNPPATAITNPPSATAEQILSGTIPITWTATDIEDADDTTLDISIDYSADGGNTWTNIMTGTNNNIAPFTYNWNTVSAGIPDGPGYKLRIKAIDSHGDWSRPVSEQAFSIDNTVNDKWYFQLEVTDPNKDLDMKPVENTATTIATASITNGGQWIIGTWDTTQTFTDKNINGAWTFNVYAKTPNPSNNPLVAYLYAKVFTSSNTGTPLDTTILDNENVGAFQTTHLFTWTDTLAGNVVNGDALLVEIWLSVSGGPYPPISGVNTNYAFNTSATPWTFSNWVSSATMIGTSSGAWVGTGGNPGGFVGITLTPPGTGATTLGIASGYWEQSFSTGMIPFEATLSFDWRCTGICTFNRAYTYAYIFIDTASGAPTIGTQVWRGKVDNTFAWSSIGPLDVKSKVNAATTYYLKICFRTAHQKGDPASILGYDNVKLSWGIPSPITYMEYDYGTTQSNVAPFLGSGSGPTSYAIPLTGKTANSWVFISFPSAMSGNIDTLLTDPIDSGTTWTVAKWFNAANKTDPWKTHRKGSSVNDMPVMTNQMGVWLWITANGGDQKLSLSSYTANSSVNVLITLKAGWNMVGYPSATSRAESATLPAAADLVASWQVASPYITQHAKGATLMVPGNAYWVHATADTTWTVAP